MCYACVLRWLLDVSRFDYTADHLKSIIIMGNIYKRGRGREREREGEGREMGKGKELF